MVLGLATGNPIGIAGGLFHMVNNTIYKCCLFLSGGNVEYKTKTSNLDSLGGLAKIMPVTFFTSLVASLAISGVPPFNGFFSKWMIYQGLIEKGKSGGVLWVFCLIAAGWNPGRCLDVGAGNKGGLRSAWDLVLPKSLVHRYMMRYFIVMTRMLSTGRVTMPEG